MWAFIISNIGRGFIPICLFVWAVFSPGAGGYAFIGLYVAFQASLFFIDSKRPDPDPAIWTANETVVLRRYHIALRYPAVARAVSSQLNCFRWTGLVFFTPLFLWNHMWVAGAIPIASFFNPKLSNLAVRLDPFRYLGDAVKRGLRQFEPELTVLTRVSDKYKRCPVAPAPAATLEDAFSAHGRGDYSAALRILRPFAEQGKAEAQSFMAGMYHDGHGVPRDYAEAMKWYQKAAGQGLADARRRIGDLYYNGHGVPRDHAEASRWYRMAAEQGDAEAQFRLGGIFFDKQTKALLQGAPQDIAEPIKWYTMAAEQGHGDAQYFLGFLYSGDMFGTQDYVQAYKWLDLAASHFTESNAKAREKAVEGRDSIAGMMTPGQIAEARKLASEWRPAPASR